MNIVGGEDVMPLSIANQLSNESPSKHLIIEELTKRYIILGIFINSLCIYPFAVIICTVHYFYFWIISLALMCILDFFIYFFYVSEEHVHHGVAIVLELA